MFSLEYQSWQVMLTQTTCGRSLYRLSRSGQLQQAASCCHIVAGTSVACRSRILICSCSSRARSALTVCFCHQLILRPARFATGFETVASHNCKSSRFEATSLHLPERLFGLSFCFETALEHGMYSPLVQGLLTWSLPTSRASTIGYCQLPGSHHVWLQLC